MNGLILIHLPWEISSDNLGNVLAGWRSLCHRRGFIVFKVFFQLHSVLVSY
jgi:hypothetical protein